MPLEEWNRRWSALLEEAVRPQDGRVDYARLHEDPEELDELVAALAPERSFEDDTQRLAFLLNAYNALVIRRVLDHWPIPSVRQVDGFFDRERFELLGESVSLTAVRDRMIRPMGEPRAHMAMAGGAMGYPPLRAEAYRAGALDAQLDHQSRRFLTSPAHNTVLADRAMLSPLFEWFAADFEAEPYGGPLGFVRHHVPEDSPLGRLLSRADDPPVTYLDFNWALNGR